MKNKNKLEAFQKDYIKLLKKHSDITINTNIDGDLYAIIPFSNDRLPLPEDAEAAVTLQA